MTTNDAQVKSDEVPEDEVRSDEVPNKLPEAQTVVYVNYRREWLDDIASVSLEIVSQKKTR